VIWRAEVDARIAAEGTSFRWRAIATLLLGTFVAVMEGTVVNVALPAIQREFGIGYATAQVLATAFLAATTVTMLMAPWTIRRFGLRRAYGVAVGCLLLASLMAALVGHLHFSILVVCRILQGAAAGLIQPIAMVGLLPLFPPNAHGRAMAVYGLGIVLAPAIGPVVGGLLVDSLGWSGVFLVAVPPSAAAWYGCRRYLYEGRGEEASVRLPDLPSLALISFALVAVLTSVPTFGSESALPLLLAGLVAGVCFVLRQRRLADPLLNPRLFSAPGVGAGLGVALVYGAGLYGSTYLIPLFAQHQLNASAFAAGLLLLPGGAALAAILPLGGTLADRIEVRKVVVAGLLCFAGGSGALALSGSSTALIWVATWVVLGRIGLGLLIPSLNGGVMRLADPDDLNAVTAAMNFSRQLGGALGIVLLAAWLEFSSARYDIAWGFTLGFAMVAGLFVLGAIPACRIRRVDAPV
jgi:EmrB/QacA subfamily drug resistance transporter|tara:strand:- start:10284 stop:11681 length:1398 start_codon:yes stop_codon:yes gene_type:complete